MGATMAASGWLDAHERPLLRRVSTLAIVIALHLAVLLLLSLAPTARRLAQEASPFIVRLLPIDNNDAPVPVAAPPPTGKPAPPKPPVPADLAKPAPPVSVTPRPSTLPVPTPPAAAAPAAPSANNGDISISGGGRAAPLGFAPPRWVRKITDEEFFPLMAEDLWRVPMDVTFRLRCMIAADTRIDCRILSESPTIPGVRTAVLRGLPMLRMRPPMRDGRPVLDEPVEFEWRVGQHSRFSALDR